MSAQPAQAAVPLAVVTDLEATDDADWFEANPRRLFRARRVNGGYDACNVFPTEAGGGRQRLRAYRPEPVLM